MPFWNLAKLAEGTGGQRQKFALLCLQHAVFFFGIFSWQIYLRCYALQLKFCTMYLKIFLFSLMQIKQALPSPASNLLQSCFSQIRILSNLSSHQFTPEWTFHENIQAKPTKVKQKPNCFPDKTLVFICMKEGPEKFDF